MRGKADLQGFARVVALLLVGLFLSGCSAGKGLQEVTSHGAGKLAQESRPVDIVVMAGPGWNHKFRLGGLLPVNAPPQLAIWTEATSGAYVDTLYVTEKFAKQKWGTGPTTETFRIEALPVWTNRYRDAGHVSPTRDAPLPDATTGPTPGRSFRLRASVPATEKLVRFTVEVNVSYDGNPDYPDNAVAGDPNYTGTSGQPSLVYSGIVDVTVSGEHQLILVGHGHPAGTDGRVYPGLFSVTSARQLIETCTVVVP